MGLTNFKVHIALFLVALFYAILFSWAGQIMPLYISPEAFVWLRILTAAVLFTIIGLIYSPEKVDLRKDGWYFAICAFFGTAGNMYMFFKGLSITNPINGAVLMMVTPMFVALFEHWKNQQLPAMDMIFGLLIGTAGAGMLMASKGAGFNADTLEGDIWIAVNAAFYAVYLVLVKKLVHKYQPVTVNRITFGMGIFFIAPLGAEQLIHTNFAAIPTEIWWKILYTLLITSFLVYMLNAYAIKHGSPSLVGVYIYLQPVLATFIALGMGTDQLSISKAIYIGLVLFGVWLVLNSNKRTLSIKKRLGE